MNGGATSKALFRPWFTCARLLLLFLRYSPGTLDADEVPTNGVLLLALRLIGAVATVLPLDVN